MRVLNVLFVFGNTFLGENESNTFTFLKATRVTSADDFVKSLDKRLVGNNVILICSKKMEMEIVE